MSRRLHPYFASTQEIAHLSMALPNSVLTNEDIVLEQVVMAIPNASDRIFSSMAISFFLPFTRLANCKGSLLSRSSNSRDAGSGRSAANSSLRPCKVDLPGRHLIPPLRRILSTAFRLDSKAWRPSKGAMSDTATFTNRISKNLRIIFTIPLLLRLQW